ncbi:hypothetical protein DBV15_03780 [Temnothorax longispinosus]|uniref:Uncharacterized protein n=1 Tax=Temnothorax longispinosus TaxID=300112 RepID=A0A4S2JC53_9HYME|nr:hypothetical protein DBV15_03780 [Temnothorax longispinosus]
MKARRSVYGVLEKLMAREEEVVHWERKSSLQHASLELHDKRSEEIYMHLQNYPLLYQKNDCFRVASTIFKHPVYDHANVCSISNIVTTTMRSPSPAKGLERAICPYFRVVRTNGSGSYFDALRAVHAMSYAGGVRRRNFAPVVRRAGHPSGKPRENF